MASTLRRWLWVFTWHKQQWLTFKEHAPYELDTLVSICAHSNYSATERGVDIALENVHWQSYVNGPRSCRCPSPKPYIVEKRGKSSRYTYWLISHRVHKQKVYTRYVFVRELFTRLFECGIQDSTYKLKKENNLFDFCITNFKLYGCRDIKKIYIH